MVPGHFMLSYTSDYRDRSYDKIEPVEGLRRRLNRGKLTTKPAVAGPVSD